MSGSSVTNIPGLSSTDQSQLGQLQQLQQEAQAFQMAMAQLDTQNQKQMSLAKDEGTAGKDINVNQG